jgi:hypothetical protein
MKNRSVIQVVFPCGNRMNLHAEPSETASWKDAAGYVALPVSSWMRYFLVLAAREEVGFDHDPNLELINYAAQQQGDTASAWSRTVLNRIASDTIAARSDGA